MPRLLLRLVVLISLVTFASRVNAATSSPEASKGAVGSIAVAASDARFVYEGRFDTRSAEGPVVIWQASRIRLDFTGDTLALRFDQAKGQSYFNIEIDGRTSVLGLREDAAAKGADIAGLGAGRHHLMIFKRSEGSTGAARFRGVTIAPGAAAFAPSQPKY
jgi:hypothetical protein